MGAVLATFVSPDTTFQPSTVRKLDILGALSVIGLAFAWYRLEGASRFLYHGGFWLTEMGVLVLILCAVCGPSSLIARVLSVKPLTYLGTISYGVYLWHWPVNVLLTPERIHVRGFWLHVIQFALTFVIAIASYYLFERPIRMRGLPFGRPLVMVPAAVALALVLVVRGTYARELPGQPIVPSMFESSGESGSRRVSRDGARRLDGELTRLGFAWRSSAGRRGGSPRAGRLHDARGHVRWPAVDAAHEGAPPQRDARLPRRRVPARHVGRRRVAQVVSSGLGRASSRRTSRGGSPIFSPPRAASGR